MGNRQGPKQTRSRKHGLGRRLLSELPSNRPDFGGDNQREAESNSKLIALIPGTQKKSTRERNKTKQNPTKRTLMLDQPEWVV